MSVFYDVPKVTQVDVISSWLTLEDVAKLDLATCNHRYRKELLEAFKSPECVLGYLEFGWDYISPWVIARQIKCSAISLSVRVLAPETNRKALLEIMGPSLTSLELMCGDYGDEDEDEADERESASMDKMSMREIIDDCTRYCTALVEIRLHAANLDKKLAALIQNNPKLKCITLTECTKISSAIMGAIIACPCLETFKLEECVMKSEAFSCEFEPNTTCTTVTLTSSDTANYMPGVFAVAFPSAVTLDISILTQANLAEVASKCKAVKTAKILLHEDLELAHATAIATHWQDIRSLEINPAEQLESVCEQDVVLLFVDRCLSLERLVLAPLECTDLPPAQYSSNESHVSKIRELSVCALDEPGLLHILNKCKYLYTLGLYAPEPVDLDGGELAHTEFFLRHLQHSSVKALYLTNALNLNSAQLQKLSNLHSLVLCSAGSDYTLDASEVTEFVRRCPELHTLCIYDCETIHSKVVLAVLPVAPRLTRLEYYSGPKTLHYRETSVAWMFRCMVEEKYPNITKFEIHVEAAHEW